MRRVWNAADGRRIPYEELSNEHLVNILNKIERGGSRYPDEMEHVALQIEALSRGLKWGRNSFLFGIDRRVQESIPEPRFADWTFDVEGLSGVEKFSSTHSAFKEPVPLESLAQGVVFKRVDSQYLLLYMKLSIGAWSGIKGAAEEEFKKEPHQVLHVSHRRNHFTKDRRAVVVSLAIGQLYLFRVDLPVILVSHTVEGAFR